MSDKQTEIALSFLKESGTNFPARPKLIEDILVFQMPDGLGMQFRGLSSPVVIRGALAESLLPKLLPLLDGKHVVSELIDALKSEAAPGDVADLLKSLFTRGAIADLEVETPALDLVSKKHLLFQSRRLGATRNNSCSSEVAAKLSNSHIVVIADGLLGACTLDLLCRTGFKKITAAVTNSSNDDNEMFSDFAKDCNLEFIEVGENGVRSFLQKRLESASLVVAALRTVSQNVFAAINELCVQSEVEWLRAHDNGSTVELGPYVNPYDSACFECMLVRQISVGDYAVEDQLYQNFLEEQGTVLSLAGESIGLASQAAGYIAQEAVRIVTAIERPQLDGRVLNFYSDGNMEQNSFTRVPRCDVCARGGAMVFPEKEHAGKVL